MANVTQADGRNIKAGSRHALFYVLALIVLAELSCIGCKSSAGSAHSSSKGTHEPQVKAVLHLEPFVVNLSDSEDNRFLRAGIDLGLENPLSAKEGKEGDVPTARVRDCILAVLSTWSSDALLAPAGKQKLKDELVRALRARAPELGVKEVYFTDFLVQR